MIKEIWKDIENYEELYQISNLGRILNKQTHNIIKDRIDNSTGYMRIGLTKNNKYKQFLTHRLVAHAFIPNPENKPQVNHIDGNKTNNKIDNLEWCTSKENCVHASQNELYQKNKTIKEQIKKDIIDEKKNFHRFMACIPSYNAIPFEYKLKENGLTFNEWINREVDKIIYNKRNKKI